jgi:hypothetical protein
MFTMKNIILVLNTILIAMTLSIVLLPNIWMVSVVKVGDNVQGIVIPLIWTIYAGLVFLTAGMTFSWLIKQK